MDLVNILPLKGFHSKDQPGNTELQYVLNQHCDHKTVIEVPCNNQYLGICIARPFKVETLVKLTTYSRRPKLSTKSCFMKQKCQLLFGVTLHKNAAMPLSTSGINTTSQHFQMRCITLFYFLGLKSYQLSKLECVEQ